MVKYHQSPKELQLDRIFSALSDQTRRDMIERLSAGQKSASDLASLYNISFPAVSKHLRVLQQSNLAQVTKVGRQRIFRINPAQLRQVQTWIQYWSHFWNASMDNLENFLKK